MRPWKVTGIAVLAGSAFTLATIFAEPVALAHRSPETKIALETTETLIALLTALLIYGRYLRSGSRAEELLVYTLVVVAGTNLFFGVLPKILPGIEGQGTLVWAPLTSRLVAGLSMAVAALLPAGRGRLPRRHAAWIITAAAGGTLLLIWAGTVFFGDLLPIGVPLSSGLNLRRLLVVGHPVLLGTQLVVFGLFAVSAYGFTRSAERTGDKLMTWFGAGAALGAIARLNYFLFPSIYTSYVYVGDVLRLGYYLLLLVGSALEIRGYWREMQEMALTDRLTGLANRHGFEILAGLQLRIAKREGHPAAAVFVDLDGMKAINDELGHEEGDRALLDTAEVLRRTFRETDIVCRLGGDEFCVLLADATDAEGAVDRLRAGLDSYRRAEPRRYELSLSAGVAVGNDGLAELLAEADEAMYRDKLERRKRSRR